MLDDDRLSMLRVNIDALSDSCLESDDRLSILRDSKNIIEDMIIAELFSDEG